MTPELSPSTRTVKKVWLVRFDLFSPSLRAKTPVPGLFLTGQDVATPGVTGAMMGAMLAAAAIEPRLFVHLS